MVSWELRVFHNALRMDWSQVSWSLSVWKTRFLHACQRGSGPKDFKCFSNYLSTNKKMLPWKERSRQKLLWSSCSLAVHLPDKGRFIMCYTLSCCQLNGHHNHLCAGNHNERQNHPHFTWALRNRCKIWCTRAKRKGGRFNLLHSTLSCNILHKNKATVFKHRIVVFFCSWVPRTSKQRMKYWHYSIDTNQFKKSASFRSLILDPLPNNMRSPCRKNVLKCNTIEKNTVVHKVY